MRRALQKAGIKSPLVVAAGGAEAKAYLRRCGPAAGDNRRRAPAVVLLDVNMPEVSGFDVLQWIRHKPELRNLKVIMVSSSERDQDVRRATELGADGYLVKFPSPAELGAKLRAFAIE